MTKNVDSNPHFKLINNRNMTMKKSKLVIASVCVSLTLLATQVSAGPTKQPDKRIEVQQSQSLSEWFFSLFDF